jgi:hypothetical protein
MNSARQRIVPRQILPLRRRTKMRIVAEQMLSPDSTGVTLLIVEPRL